MEDHIMSARFFEYRSDDGQPMVAITNNTLSYEGVYEVPPERVGRISKIVPERGLGEKMQDWNPCIPLVPVLTRAEIEEKRLPVPSGSSMDFHTGESIVRISRLALPGKSEELFQVEEEFPCCHCGSFSCTGRCA
jgi:hypothetical protein